MKEAKKERNYVDVFSNYGLDERQRSASSNIGFRCFRELYNVTLIITILWYIADCFADGEIPVAFVIGSYFAAAIVCYCVYAVRAAKAGVINGIAAFSFSTRNLAAAIFTAFVALVFGLSAAGILGLTDKTTNAVVIAVFSAMLSAENFVLCFCGRKNSKVLDEQNKEEEDHE